MRRPDRKESQPAADVLARHLALRERQA